MKMLVAIIRPEKLVNVQQALYEQDFCLITISEVRGCGRQRGFSEVVPGLTAFPKLLRKVKIEIVVPDQDVERIIGIIEKSSRSGSEGRVGDGKIFVLGVDDCIRIRTGERGTSAIA